MPGDFYEIVDYLIEAYTQRRRRVYTHYRYKDSKRNNTSIIRAAKYIIKNEAKIEDWVEAQFDRYGEDTFCNCLTGKKAENNYKEYIKTQSCTASNRVIKQINKLSELTENTSVSIDTILENPVNGFSDLFKYCILVTQNEREQADKFKKSAKNQLKIASNRSAYKMVFSDIIELLENE
jgi:hypothetical protein